MSMKNFYLSAKLFVSLCLAGFTSTAYAQNGTPRAAKPMGEVATEQTTVELLDDPFSIHLMMVSLRIGLLQELLLN